eukprot:scaffold33999_cov50-Attheya_sp.AAC.1
MPVIAAGSSGFGTAELKLRVVVVGLPVGIVVFVVRPRNTLLRWDKEDTLVRPFCGCCCCKERIASLTPTLIAMILLTLIFVAYRCDEKQTRERVMDGGRSRTRNELSSRVNIAPRTQPIDE